MPSDGPPNLLTGHIAELVEVAQWAHVYPDAVVHDAGSPPSPGYARGKPVAILNHFTAVCGSVFPGFGRFGSEGIGSGFGIKRDGTVCQYVDADRATWHAFGRSRYAVGIEWDALPKGCPINPAQVIAGVKLNAWLCQEFAIFPVRALGPGEGAIGIGCHTDGLQPGAIWDPNGHYDSPCDATGDQIAAWVSNTQRGLLDTSPVDMGSFISQVRGGGDDDMTDAEAAAAAAEAFGFSSTASAKFRMDYLSGYQDGRQSRNQRPIGEQTVPYKDGLAAGIADKAGGGLAEHTHGLSGFPEGTGGVK